MGVRVPLLPAVVRWAGVELVQAPLPGRYFSVGDAAANALGAALVTPWFLVARYLEFVPAGTWLRGLADRPGER